MFSVWLTIHDDDDDDDDNDGVYKVYRILSNFCPQFWMTVIH